MTVYNNVPMNGLPISKPCFQLYTCDPVLSCTSVVYRDFSREQKGKSLLKWVISSSSPLVNTYYIVNRCTRWLIYVLPPIYVEVTISLTWCCFLCLRQLVMGQTRHKQCGLKWVGCTRLFGSLSHMSLRVKQKTWMTQVFEPGICKM